MMMNTSDTIVALATPAGRSALAVIRLSGMKAVKIAETLAGRGIEPRRATHVLLRDARGEVLDDAVVTLWVAPHSYTGEDVAELSCHGNMKIVEAVIRCCVEQGARLAGPGEFTQRAFLNERMDLTQAEAVMDLIEARSERALRAARLMQSGVLGTEIRQIQEDVLQILAHLEAYIDFPEEGIDPETGEQLLGRIHEARNKVEELLKTAPEGRHLREGFRVVLTGAPNAGKSSLLNALLKRDRAIVSAVAGTTRDTIEEVITLAGMMVRLTDTAGLREEGDELEALGMARTRAALAEADLVVHLTAPDAASEPPEVSVPMIRVAAKCDLAASEPTGLLRVSAHTGEGLEALQQEITRHLHLDERSLDHERVAINARHEAVLDKAREALIRAEEAQRQGRPPELVSADLRRALEALGEVVGATTEEDVLDRLFARFCIGK